jgi:hypothetical protein
MRALLPRPKPSAKGGAREGIVAVHSPMHMRQAPLHTRRPLPSHKGGARMPLHKKHTTQVGA